MDYSCLFFLVKSVIIDILFLTEHRRIVLLDYLLFYMSDIAKRDDNQVPSVLAVSSTDGISPVTLWADPVSHRLLVQAIGSIGTSVKNEIVSGSGTSFTLANTPVTGTVDLRAMGQFLTPGAGNDYTISGAVITIIQTGASYPAGSVVAFYEK